MECPSTWLGVIHLEAPCPNCCSGTVTRPDGDRIAHDDCELCGGVGRVPVRASDRMRRFVRPLGRL
jgi:hypothetical protein